MAPRVRRPLQFHPTYDQLKREVESLRSLKLVEEFAKKFSESLGTIAASTPYCEWPKEFKVAFRFIQGQMPAASFEYLKRLPQ